MRMRPFGALGHVVPVVGQGTWQMPTNRDKTWPDAVEALVTGIKSGMTHIDTAEMYGSGQAEELIASAIRGFSRDDLFIVSKVLPENASFKGTKKACESSLRRMKLDHLDCYLIHWRGSIPLEETMGGLEDLVKEGKIRGLGVSNFDVEDLQEAQACLSREKIICNQVLYHLAERGIERNLIPYCQSKNIAVVGYTPFGQRSIPDRSNARGAVLHKVAAKYGVTPRQLILSFLTRLDGMYTIPKASKSEHVRENAGALKLDLEPEDIGIIDEAFPAPSSDRPLATL